MDLAAPKPDLPTSHIWLYPEKRKRKELWGFLRALCEFSQGIETRVFAGAFAGFGKVHRSGSQAVSASGLTKLRILAPEVSCPWSLLLTYMYVYIYMNICTDVHM